jgi:hypothetical protein
VACPPDTDVTPYAAAGATWWLTEFAPEGLTLDRIGAVIDDGPVS